MQYVQTYEHYVSYIKGTKHATKFENKSTLSSIKMKEHKQNTMNTFGWNILLYLS